jgi:formylglycine-generating enzyme required for sulfatase activity
VENVAWAEAVAFCRWLSTKLGYEVRLPTEWEWQQAATGGNSAKEYPWGPWDSSRANTYESDLQRSTAVGMYHLGISPVGALDMSGNLWEYCLNEYDNPKRIEVSGEKSRAVRGGCWNFYRDNARCACRYWDSPNDRNSGVGFRLVCASPIS